MPIPNMFVRAVVSALAVAMLGMSADAIAWAFAESREGRPLFGRLGPPRVAPWGLGTMLLVVFTFFMVSGVVQVGYLGVRSTLGWRIGPPPTPRADPTEMKAEKPGTPPSKAKAGPRSDAPAEPLLTVTEMMFLTLVPYAALLPLLPWIVLSTSKTRPADLGLSADGLGASVRLGVLSFYLVVPAVYFVMGLALLFFRPNAHPLETMVRGEKSPLTVVLAVLSAVVFAPAFEELLFRGMLQTWLGRLFRGSAGRKEPEPVLVPVGTELEKGELSGLDVFEPTERDIVRGRRADLGAVIVTSLLFAAAHGSQMPAPIPLFVLSMALGALYQRTRNLAAPVALHAMFNGLSTLMLLIATG